MRYLGSFYHTDATSKQIDRIRQADYLRTRGTDKIPLPPRDILVQSGPRGVFVTWKAPLNRNEEISAWRVFKGDESSLYAELADRGARAHFVETTAGATPPVTNIYVCSVNALGIPSPLVSAQGSAIVEAGAPTMPSFPPGWQNEAAGGGQISTGGNTNRERE